MNQPHRRRVLSKRKRPTEDNETLCFSWEHDIKSESAVIEWQRREGSSFRKGDILAFARTKIEGSDAGVASSALIQSAGTILAARDGILSKILVGTGSDVVPGSDSVVGTVRLCDHPAVVSGQCAVCGLVSDDVVEKSGTHKRVTLHGEASELEVSEAEALRIRDAEMLRLNSARKLQLIMDIDHTLLECTSRPPEVDSSTDASIVPLPLYGGRSMHWVKLRPGLREFLATASTLFELTLYTNGKREYLLAVARALDPTKQLFADRLISTPDDVPDLNECQAKSLDRLFPGGIERCLVMDDRDDIWQGEQGRHLLLVKPYKFWKFQATQRKGPQAPVEDFQLQMCLDLLTRVHRRYYHGDEPRATVSLTSSSSSVNEAPSLSVAQILDVERANVLKGLSFVFSGVFPMGADVAASREAQWIRRLGGNVDVSLTASTTHVIARVPGTDKVLEGAARGLHVVHLDWLWYTIWYCQRANETALRLVRDQTTERRAPPSDSVSGGDHRKLGAGEVLTSAQETVPSSVPCASPPCLASSVDRDSGGGESESDDDLLREVEIAMGSSD